MAAKRKKTQKQTLAEFRAWLLGVEEISGPDWAPDKGQWKTIRDRISNIVEPEPVVREVASAPRAAAPAGRAPGATPLPSDFIPPAPAIPSAFDRAGVPPGQAVSPGGAPPTAGIPPGNASTAFAQPGIDGVPKTPAPPGGVHAADGTTFE